MSRNAANALARSGASVEVLFDALEDTPFTVAVSYSGDSAQFPVGGASISCGSLNLQVRENTTMSGVIPRGMNCGVGAGFSFWNQIPRNKNGMQSRNWSAEILFTFP